MKVIDFGVAKATGELSTATLDSGFGGIVGTPQSMTEPKRLADLLRNELDWIVMKALEKDRGRRYETAAGFAADVRRYLGGEAVLALPPSRGYRLKKFARRNKGQVIAATTRLSHTSSPRAGERPRLHRGN